MKLLEHGIYVRLLSTWMSRRANCYTMKKKVHHFINHLLFMPFFRADFFSLHSNTFSSHSQLFPQLLIKTHTYYISTMNKHEKRSIPKLCDSLILPAKFRYVYGQCRPTATIPFEPIFSAFFRLALHPILWFHSIRFHIGFIRSIGGFPHIMKFMNYW